MGKLTSGSIFAIPAGSYFGAAKVIYVSERYKDVFLIKLLQQKFDSEEAIYIESKFDSFTLFYVGVMSIKKGEWRLLGEQGVSDAEKRLSRRIVAQDVWVEDTHIGPASEDDFKELKHMDVYGWVLIQKAIMRLENQPV